MDNLIMKTGLGDHQGLSSNSHEMTNFLRVVSSIMKVLMEEAVGTATKFVKSCNRTCITPDDIRLALKYEAHEFFDKNDWEDRFNQVLEDENTHTYETDESEIDEEGDIESDVDSNDEIETFSPEFVSGDSELHAAIMKYDSEWDDWYPDDPVKILLKRAIDNC